MRGYYVYNDNLEPLTGETLDCAKETSKPFLCAPSFVGIPFQFLGNSPK